MKKQKTQPTFDTCQRYLKKYQSKFQLFQEMSTDRLRPLAGVKPIPAVTLNHYIFSGIKNKPSRDDIYKKILIPKPKFQQKGLIFVWPQKPTSFFYKKEIISCTWFIAHTLYWLHVINLFPTGAVLPFKQPPSTYEPPLYRPKSRDFIIEPDWDSV